MDVCPLLPRGARPPQEGDIFQGPVLASWKVGQVERTPLVPRTGVRDEAAPFHIGGEVGKLRVLKAAREIVPDATRRVDPLMAGRRGGKAFDQLPLRRL